MSIQSDEEVRYVRVIKRKSSPISLSASDEDINELLEIKPPQPKVHKHGRSVHQKYLEKRDKHHKHSSSRHNYHGASLMSTYYKPAHSSAGRYESDRRYYRHENEKDSTTYSGNREYYSETDRESYQKHKHHSYHRLHESRKDTKPRELRYIEEEEQALKEEIKRKEEELRLKIEKRKHHQKNSERNSEKSDNEGKAENKFIQADRLKEAYHKESEERMKKHDKDHKQSVDCIIEKTPPRAYDTDRTLKSSVVVVSDESQSPSKESDEEEISSTSIVEDILSNSTSSPEQMTAIIESSKTIIIEHEDVEQQETISIEEEEITDESEDDSSKSSSSGSGSSSSNSSQDGEMTSSSTSSLNEEAISNANKLSAEQRNKHDSKSHPFVDMVEIDRQLNIKKYSPDKNGVNKQNSLKIASSMVTSEEPPIGDIPRTENKLNIKKYFPALQGCRSVEQFHCLNKIEEGTYGIVYRARDKRTNQIVALKRLKMEKEKEGFPITSLREINTLLKAQHPNIVTVREIVVGSNMDKIFIVMDYVEHDLKSLMETMKQRKSSFIASEVKCLMTQLLLAVDHLHDNWILHRDLKTSNLLFSHQGILKVGDFGLAREYGSPLKHYTSVVVTLWYRAPELLLGTKLYSTAIDMWSIGCIFAELLLMEPLFTGKSEADQINRIFKMLGTPTDQQWPEFRKMPIMQKVTFANYPPNSLRSKIAPHLLSDVGYDLLLKFLTYDPKERITAEAGLRHDYFKEHPIAIEPAMFPTWPAKSEPGYSKMKAESPKAPSGGQGYKDLGEDDGFFIGERLRGPAYHSSFCLKF